MKLHPGATVAIACWAYHRPLHLRPPTLLSPARQHFVAISILDTCLIRWGESASAQSCFAVSPSATSPVPGTPSPTRPQRHWTTKVLVAYSNSQKLQYITQMGMVLQMIGVRWKHGRANSADNGSVGSSPRTPWVALQLTLPRLLTCRSRRIGDGQKQLTVPCAYCHVLPAQGLDLHPSTP